MRTKGQGCRDNCIKGIQLPGWPHSKDLQSPDKHHRALAEGPSRERQGQEADLPWSVLTSLPERQSTCGQSHDASCQLPPIPQGRQMMVPSPPVEGLHWTHEGPLGSFSFCVPNHIHFSYFYSNEFYSKEVHSWTSSFILSEYTASKIVRLGYKTVRFRIWFVHLTAIVNNRENEMMFLSMYWFIFSSFLEHFLCQTQIQAWEKDKTHALFWQSSRIH